MLSVYTEMQTVEGDMATANPEALDALNLLLEDQRASVEIDVALAMGATEIAERDFFTSMGSEDVLACVVLRERLEEANVAVTRRINGIVLVVLDTETYDDRLRAFVELHLGICERVNELLPQTTDHQIRKLLQELYDHHLRNAQWCAQRAEAFAHSRTLDFRAPQRPPDTDERVQDGADGQSDPLEPAAEAPRERAHADPEASDATAPYGGWYGQDEVDGERGAESGWQDDGAPSRYSRHLRASDVWSDGH